ncbi:hypothetical protein IU459_35675 [Nocardia amamiensis]|uniref:Uncharacterized protein n=1 Tax=Nocardia amamiensis TaxID=404578 RepID=A0ABS0D1Z1_9NOCA|nr:hypothetical protein [Nocardia amamiensis]MBF6302829.1 hypothetical protein [Nocardia amamiensis]
MSILGLFHPDTQGLGMDAELPGERLAGGIRRRITVESVQHNLHRKLMLLDRTTLGHGPHPSQRRERPESGSGSGEVVARFCPFYLHQLEQRVGRPGCCG